MTTERTPHMLLSRDEYECDICGRIEIFAEGWKWAGDIDVIQRFHRRGAVFTCASCHVTEEDVERILRERGIENDEVRYPTS